MRARNIKPGFFENEELAELSYECRLLYIGLWCYADREGRFEWRPKRIKALIFPYDNVDIDKLLNVITCKGHVMTYNYNENTYGFIPTFLKHNRPHPHEAKSQCPPPPDDIKQQHRKMSLHVTDMSVKCTSDIMNDDIMNDDKRNDVITCNDISVKSNDNGIPYGKIIAHLNAKTNSSYKFTTQKTRSLIYARWKEGFRLEDFFYVIDIKTIDWLNDSDNQKYLRPETLFGTKFEGYRNQKRKLTKEEKDEQIKQQCIEEYYKKHPEERNKL